MNETLNTKWVRPEARHEAAQRARRRANTVSWSLDTAIFLFGVLALVLILSFEGASILITAPVAIFGLIAVWFAGWRKARHSYGEFFETELARCPDDWKDYYEILQISPESEPEKAAEAYERLSHVFDEALSDEARDYPMYAAMKEDAEEAYRVICERESRADYDQVYWLRINQENTVIDESTRSEIVGLTQSVARDILESRKRLNWRIIQLPRAAQQAILAAGISLLMILLGGTSLAFARPDSALASPFKGVAISLAKTSGGAIILLEDVRGVAATFERKVLSTALQSMRVDKGLMGIPVVTEPINDMTLFPSPLYPLYPDYLETRFSQFKYTVDSNGIISVDASGATTDAFSKRIERIIQRLEAGE